MQMKSPKIDAPIIIGSDVVLELSIGASVVVLLSDDIVVCAAIDCPEMKSQKHKVAINLGIIIFFFFLTKRRKHKNEAKGKKK